MTLANLTSKADRGRGRRRLGRSGIIAGVAAASIAFATEANAQGSGGIAEYAAEVANARDLVAGAKVLADKGDLAGARVKLEEAEAAHPTAEGSLALGDCYERLKLTASAWAAFLRASERARGTGDATTTREADARARALEPRLTKLKVKSSIHQLVAIRIDDRGTTSSREAIAIPLDPGPHTIEASSPGKESFTTQVILEREGETKEVMVPDLRDLPAAPTSPEPRRSEAVRNTTIVFAVWGALSLCTGFALVSITDASKGTHEAGGVLMGVGGGALAATVILILATSPTSSAPKAVFRPAPKLAIVPSIEPSSGGVLLRGAF